MSHGHGEISPNINSNITMNNGDSFPTSPLREVFDLCDTEKRGYISVDRFKELAEQFVRNNGQTDTEKIDQVVSVLDTEKNGIISFDEFANGVKEILQSNQLHRGKMGDTVLNDFFGGKQSIEDSKLLTPEMFETEQSLDLMSFEDSNSFHVNHSTPRQTNQNSRTNHSMTGSLEEDVDSGSWSATPQEINWPPKERHNQQNEQHLNGQNFNHSNNNDYYDDGEDERGVSYFVRKCPSTPISTPRSSTRSAHRVSAPSSRSGSFRKSVTPSSVASQLYRSTLNCSDFYQESNDLQVVDLTEKITKLEDQVNTLSETQRQSEDKQLKMKEENALLVERRVHILEEQLRDLEVMNDERFKEEQKKHKELLMRTEKDKTNQIELLTQSLKLIESEYSQMKNETPALKTENEQLKRQNFSLERELAKLRQECSELNDEKINLQEVLQKDQTEMNKERLVQSQLLDQLTQELNELRHFKNNSVKMSPSLREDSEMPRSLKVEMETQIIQLKQETANLKYQLEELQAILLNKQIEEGQALVNDQNQSLNTLAAELEEVPKNELMQAFQREQESNRKLREYIESMTLRILESNPNLLEIHGKKNGDKKK